MRSKNERVYRPDQAEGACKSERSDELSNVGPLAGLLGVRLRRLDLLLADALYTRDTRADEVVGLAIIGANPGISQNELARMTRRDSALIVGMVNNLESRGLADRQISLSDRRKHALHLTQAGQAELQRAAHELRATEAGLLAALAPEELAFFNYLLDKAYASCLSALQGSPGKL